MKITENTISLLRMAIVSYNVWGTKYAKALTYDEREKYSKLMLNRLYDLRSMINMLNSMDPNNIYSLKVTRSLTYAYITGIIKTSITGKKSYIIKC